MRYSPLLFCALSFFSFQATATMCTANNASDEGLAFEPKETQEWIGWGGNEYNTRNNNSASNPINSNEIENLALQWAFAFPDSRSVIGNPTISGDRIFIGSENGEVYALDLHTGCTHWVFQADNGVRTTPIVENINDKWTIIFGDRSAQVYALNAQDGSPLWKRKVESHQAAILTGAPQYITLENTERPERILVPVSSSEEGLAAVPTHPCCGFRGSVVSLDATNGNIIWQSHTIVTEATEQSPGKFGPSGAAIWSAPTIDKELGRFYVTTGDAYSAPADIATDAVIAMDLSSGEILWINQGTADDIWTVMCLTPNAPDECGPDQDFGAPGMLVWADDSHSYLLSGQKSSIVRAHHRLSGEVLWQTALAENTTEFGGKIVWGGASDNTTAYYGMGTGEISALSLSDGTIQWSTLIEPPTDRENRLDQDGPVTLSHDLLFAGAWDGVLRALDTADGEVLWQYDTATPFESVNGIEGNGGSMGAVGQIVEDGYLIVPSGYVGVKNGMPGNVLLVFALKNQSVN